MFQEDGLYDDAPEDDEDVSGLSSDEATAIVSALNGLIYIFVIFAGRSVQCSKNHYFFPILKQSSLAHLPMQCLPSLASSLDVDCEFSTKSSGISSNLVFSIVSFFRFSMKRSAEAMEDTIQELVYLTQLETCQ